MIEVESSLSIGTETQDKQYVSARHASRGGRIIDGPDASQTCRTNQDSV